MLEFHKSIVVNENQKPIAVQIPFAEFERIEEVIENFGLAKLMAETEDDERLSGGNRSQACRTPPERDSQGCLELPPIALAIEGRAKVHDLE